MPHRRPSARAPAPAVGCGVGRRVRRVRGPAIALPGVSDDGVDQVARDEGTLGPDQGHRSPNGRPADASAAVTAAWLPMLGEEEVAVHHHVHLDVYADGRPVPGPARLGVDDTRQLTSSVHTHDGSGIVHLESATETPFTLRQLLASGPAAARRTGRCGRYHRKTHPARSTGVRKELGESL